MRKHLFLLLGFASLVSLAVFYQCGKYNLVPNICFQRDIQPIFVSKCSMSGCHSSQSSGGKGRHLQDFTTYEGIMNAVTPYHPLLSSAYTKCSGIGASMPPSPNPQLTSTELEYIKYWIHTGAKNGGSCQASTTCDTTNVSFSGKIQPLLNTWCVGCHNTARPQAGYDLSNYAGVKNAITPDNRLYGCVAQLPGYIAMPEGGSKLDSCDIKAIASWINHSYPNN